MDEYSKREDDIAIPKSMVYGLTADQVSVYVCLSGKQAPKHVATLSQGRPAIIVCGIFIFICKTMRNFQS